jgi:hypothetical protein
MRCAGHVTRIVEKKIHKNLFRKKLKEINPLKYLSLDGGVGLIIHGFKVKRMGDI